MQFLRPIAMFNFEPCSARAFGCIAPSYSDRSIQPFLVLLTKHTPWCVGNSTFNSRRKVYKWAQSLIFSDPNPLVLNDAPFTDCSFCCSSHRHCYCYCSKCSSDGDSCEEGVLVTSANMRPQETSRMLWQRVQRGYPWFGYNMRGQLSTPEDAPLRVNSKC